LFIGKYIGWKEILKRSKRVILSQQKLTPKLLSTRFLVHGNSCFDGNKQSLHDGSVHRRKHVSLSVLSFPVWGLGHVTLSLTCFQTTSSLSDECTLTKDFLLKVQPKDQDTGRGIQAPNLEILVQLLLCAYSALARWASFLLFDESFFQKRLFIAFVNMLALVVVEIWP